jgi:hypothetical protein
MDLRKFTIESYDTRSNRHGQPVVNLVLSEVLETHSRAQARLMAAIMPPLSKHFVADKLKPGDTIEAAVTFQERGPTICTCYRRQIDPPKPQYVQQEEDPRPASMAERKRIVEQARRNQADEEPIQDRQSERTTENISKSQ